jgi:hypothetical protein
MAYTTINKSTDYFNTKLYTGNGGTNALTGVGFQPDWVWIKNRTSGQDHQIYDAVRGVNKKLESNNTDAEATLGGGLQAFGTDGFTLGDHNESNDNGDNYASWNWKANGAGSSNSDGNVTTTVSVNTTAGFSIVSYTGNGTTGATVGHGLGVKPNLIILKYRNVGSTNWQVYHSGLGATKYLQLNSNGASTTSNTRWNDVEPTNQVFTLGSSGDVKTNGGEYIAYCFAEKRGFSKFGAYDGNGNADGPFIYTGFKPAFVIIKPSSYANSWLILDNKRNTFNPTNTRLEADGTGADYSGLDYADFLSNGFKIRTSNAHPNNSGGTLIYMAFAEAPLVGTNNVPCTAR